MAVFALFADNHLRWINDCRPRKYVDICLDEVIGELERVTVWLLPALRDEVVEFVNAAVHCNESVPIAAESF